MGVLSRFSHGGISEFGNKFAFDILPQADNTYDLGSAALSWRNAHFQTAVYATSVVGNWSPSATGTYTLGTDTLGWLGIKLDASSGADADIDIIKLLVTGTPKFWWDESSDSFALTHDLIMADGKGITTGWANDDYFTIGAVDNDTNTITELMRFVGAASPKIVVSSDVFGNSTFVSFGDAADTGHSLDSEDDVLVTGELEVHTNLYVDGDAYLGTLDIDDDSGAVTLVDMGVTADPADGTEESYSFAIDGNTMLKLYSEADSAGAVDNKFVISPVPLCLDDADSATISGGSIAVTSSNMKVVVEGGTGSGADQLDTATGGKAGAFLILQPATSGANDQVTVADGTGAGAFILAGGANFVMDHVDDILFCMHNGVEWKEISRSSNS